MLDKINKVRSASIAVILLVPMVATACSLGDTSSSNSGNGSGTATPPTATAASRAQSQTTGLNTGSSTSTSTPAANNGSTTGSTNGTGSSQPAQQGQVAGQNGVPAVQSGAGQGGAPWQVPPEQQAVVQVVKHYGQAVVTVVNTLDPSQAGFGGEALGSGFLVDQNGTIFTNNHVIEGSSPGGLSVIYYNGASAQAQLVGADPVSDLAVLRVKGAVPAVAPMGDSDQLQVGETVVAIGSALGDFRNTVTVGVVSGLNRDLPGTDGTDIEPMIQTDAAINHGNSGGPLFDLYGHVIGIDTAVIRGANTSGTSTDASGDVAEGLGFAIPINTVKTITSQLISKGTVPHAYLGVASRDVSPQLAQYYGLTDQNGNLLQNGALVTAIGQGTPAAEANLQPGDVIVSVNGTNIDQDHPLANVLLGFQPGQTVTLDIVRNGKASNVQVQLGTRPAQQGG